MPLRPDRELCANNSIRTSKFSRVHHLTRATCWAAALSGVFWHLLTRSGAALYNRHCPSQSRLPGALRSVLGWLLDPRTPETREQPREVWKGSELWLGLLQICEAEQQGLGLCQDCVGLYYAISIASGPVWCRLFMSGFSHLDRSASSSSLNRTTRPDALKGRRAPAGLVQGSHRWSERPCQHLPLRACACQQERGSGSSRWSLERPVPRG